MVALNNQVLSFLYSMFLNMAKTQGTSVKELKNMLLQILDVEIVRDITNNTSDNIGHKLMFVKKCLIKKKYYEMFWVIRLGIKAKRR